MTRIFRAAIKAANTLQYTMQVDQISAARRCMQIVHILLVEAGQITAAFRRGTGVVGIRREKDPLGS